MSFHERYAYGAALVLVVAWLLARTYTPVSGQPRQATER
jgi:hypothetical protein